MNRQEHLQWCKKRALEELKENGVASAAASFVSDMGKHEQTKNPMTQQLILFAMMSNDPKQLEECINGFN